MTSARNRVIAGDMQGARLWVHGNALTVSAGNGDEVRLTKTYVEDWEKITEETQKSAASGIARGLVGSALLGPVGLLAGLSAKSMYVYCVLVVLKDGRQLLLEMDDKLYRAFVTGVI